MKWLSWPNQITIARVLMIAPLVICMMNMNASDSPWPRRAALVLFVLMALSDGLDGYLARRLGQKTAVGRFLDPLADKLLIATMIVLLAIEATGVPGAILPNWVPVIAIGKDLVTVGGFSLIYASTGRIIIRPRPLGKACTAVQLVMIALVLAAPDLPDVARTLPIIAWWTASLIAVAAIIDYLRWGDRAVHADAERPSQTEDPDA